jgi:hypothetical protein
MGKFISILDENYKEQSQMGLELESKIEYVGNVIFDFTTYDGEIDVLFANRMIPVLKSILDRETFEYIKDEEQYINYLTMVNMPFLVDKLEWGGSIRGAWFDNFQEYEIDCGRIEIKKGELEGFIKDLIDWLLL